MFGLLAIIPSDFQFTLLGGHFSAEFIGALLMPTLVIGAMFAVPMLDKSSENLYYAENPTNYPKRLGIGVAFFTLLLVWSVAGYKGELVANGYLPSAQANLILWALSFILPAITYGLTQAYVAFVRNLRRADEKETQRIMAYGHDD